MNEFILINYKKWEEVSEKIYNSVKNKRIIIIDFRDMNVLTSHNICLLLEKTIMNLGIDEFRKYVRFRNVGDIMNILLKMNMKSILYRKSKRE